MTPQPWCREGVVRGTVLELSWTCLQWEALPRAMDTWLWWQRGLAVLLGCSEQC